MYCTKQQCTTTCSRLLGTTTTGSGTSSTKPKCTSKTTCKDVRYVCSYVCVSDVSHDRCHNECTTCFSPSMDVACWHNSALQDCAINEMLVCPPTEMMLDTKACRFGERCFEAWFRDRPLNMTFEAFRDPQGKIRWETLPTFSFDVGLGFAIFFVIVAMILTVVLTVLAVLAVLAVLSNSSVRAPSIQTKPCSYKYFQ